MRSSLSNFVTLFSPFVLAASTAQAAASYANQFVDPEVFLSGLGTWNESMIASQNTIISWAQDLSAQGPWSVTTKQAAPPSGDKHDYLSWAPYWWPDCSNVHNTTVLPPEEVWVKCDYKPRDGIFNPDKNLVMDSANFQTMSDAVFYSTIAYYVTQKSSPDDSKNFLSNAVKFIKTWFLDAETKMNPNLNYGQMNRGPDGQVGSHTGILDLKNFAKLASAVLLLRKVPSPDWTSEIDGQFNAWCKEYIQWLQTAKIAIEEKDSLNNHGSFYFNQLAALQIIVGDNDGAKTTLNDYFNGIYMGQINDNGDQPLESIRTRPYHYLCYNLAAMITNARLLIYVDPSSSTIWEKKTTKGGTIKGALDYAVALPVPQAEANYAPELFPNVALVAAKYGDDGSAKYAQFLKKSEDNYSDEAWFLWSQPLWDGKDAQVVKANATNQNNQQKTSPPNKPTENAAIAYQFSRGLVGLGVVFAVFGVIFG